MSKPADRRMLSHLNEGRVLLAIARNGNQPTYVAKIASLAPEITLSSDVSTMGPEMASKPPKRKQGGGTKPGMREAARRLCERGILLRIDARPPKKKTLTPHYTINSTIQTLAAINRSYGSWVVGGLRKAGFVGALIDREMDEHLAGLLHIPVDSVKRLPKPEKEEISYLAKKSTAALEVFLNPEFELRPATRSTKGDYDLLAQLRRLRDVMHLAFVAEVASSPGMKIWEEGWNVAVDTTTVVESGGMSLRLATTYDSKQFARKPRYAIEERAIIEKEGGSAHGAIAR